MNPPQPSGSFFHPETLVELLRQRAHCSPEHVVFRFLIDGEVEGSQLSFRELDRQARAYAAWLESLDLAGQRVLLLFPPGLEFIAAFFGCLYAGAVAVTGYPPRRNRSLDRIQAIAEDAGARYVLTTDSVLNRIQGVLAETPALKHLTWLSVEHVPPGSEACWRDPQIDAETLALLQYTSGSTGTPKGVMLTHQNLMYNSFLIDYAFEQNRSVSTVFWLPNYHDMGLVGGILQPMFSEGTNAIMSPAAFLQKPIRWLQAITKYRATTSGGPDFAYDLCVRRTTPEERTTLDLSSWALAFNGAEPIRSETIDRFCEAFAPCGFRRESFYPCYGLAEATLLVTGGHKVAPPVIKQFSAKKLEAGQVQPVEQGDPAARSLVGCGKSFPGQQVAIVDTQTETLLGERQIGEIWVQGPSVAQGYWGRTSDEWNAFAGQVPELSDKPFLRTGDLGFLDGGELFVTGRIKDLIIVRGVNHYPQDIELTVEKCHDALRPCCGAAFACNHEGTDRVVIVHEIERARRRESSDVIEAIRLAVAEKHELEPSAVVLVKTGTIPKTSSGKIQRRACREAFLANTLDTVAEWRRGALPASTTNGNVLHADPAHVPALKNGNGHVNGIGHANGSAHANANGNGHATGNGHRNIQHANHETSTNGNGHPHGEIHHVRAQRNDSGFAPISLNSVQTVPAEDLVHGLAQCVSKSVEDVTETVLDLVRHSVVDSPRRVGLDASLAELGLDSLARIDLQVLIETRFGGRIPDDVAASIHTVRDLVEAVQTHMRPVRNGAPRQSAAIPEETYRFELSAEYLALRKNREAVEASGMTNPYFTVHEGVTRDTTVVGGRRLINFSSYNYVGMSGDPVVSAAAKQAVDQYGTSVSASRLVSGERPLHRDLEQAIARWIGAEEAVVFVSGHATNETTIGHLFGPGDLILFDALSHNSIVQGTLLSGARRRPFPHNDWRTLDRILTQMRPEYRRVLIVIEGVYSMDGDIADLPRFIELKKRHKTYLMVDEAHSAGTLGLHGRGIGEHFQIDPNDVDLWMGTLSKSYASCGGYIAGGHALIEYLKYTAPGFVFSVGMSPPNAAAALAALELLEAEPHRVARLRDLAARFVDLARQHGLNTGLSQGTPVVPIILGNSLDCLRLSRALADRGINVQPILYPAVEESASRLRFFITSQHTEEQIRHTIEALESELREIDPAHLAHQHPPQVQPEPWRVKQLASTDG